MILDIKCLIIFFTGLVSHPRGLWIWNVECQLNTFTSFKKSLPPSPLRFALWKKTPGTVMILISLPCFSFFKKNYLSFPPCFSNPKVSLVSSTTEEILLALLWLLRNETKQRWLDSCHLLCCPPPPVPKAWKYGIMSLVFLISTQYLKVTSGSLQTDRYSLRHCFGFRSLWTCSGERDESFWEEQHVFQTVADDKPK